MIKEIEKFFRDKVNETFESVKQLPNQEIEHGQAQCVFELCETPDHKPGCYKECIYYTPAG